MIWRLFDFVWGSIVDPRMFYSNIGFLLVVAMVVAMLTVTFSSQARKHRESQQEPEDDEGEDPAAEFEMHSVINTVDATS